MASKATLLPILMRERSTVIRKERKTLLSGTS